MQEIGKRRVAILGVFLESNSFAQVFDQNCFENALHLVGEEITNDARSAYPQLMKEVVGFYRQMDMIGDWQPVPIIVTGGKTGGPASGAYLNEITGRIRSMLAEVQPIDGVYVANHGAMTSTESSDAEADVYQMVRDVVGPKVPIVASLDLHANLSQRTINLVDILISYRTDPHIDQLECGEETARALHELWSGVKPHVFDIRLPIVAPNVSLFTESGPLGDLIRYGQDAISSEIMNVSILAGFAYSDTPFNGLHVVVTGRNTPDAARALCCELAERAWSDRARFDWDLLSMSDAVARAVACGHDHSLPPILLSDLGDNSGGGGPTNTIWLLENLFKGGAKNVFIGNFFDPNLATMALKQGVGATFDAVFTGDTWERADDGSFRASVTVEGLHDGVFLCRRGINAGSTILAGPTALLRMGDIWVSVTSRRLICNDPVMVEALGVQLTDFRTIVVKGRGSYRVAFDEWISLENMLLVDTPGRTSPVLERHTWKKLPRPAFPIDRNFSWDVPNPRYKQG